VPEPLKDRQIVLGVCGGIGAYKSAALVRLLVQSGANVRIIMTQAAQAFVGPLTFEALSANPVWTHMFEGQPNGPFRHIKWADEADAVVVMPATANIIGKMAQGIADDPLTTLILAVKAPVLVCPSMNTHMYENPVVQRNIERLGQIGMKIMAPEAGLLACGQEGVGRLPDVEAVGEQIRSLLSPQDLAGEQILITAGPTQEPSDPVRLLSNPSSGRMGYALARAAYRRGAKVFLISGPTSLVDPLGVGVIRVRTAEEMFKAVMAHADESTIIIKAAAVSDWRPAHRFQHKIKKEEMAENLPLQKTQDILKVLGENKKDQVLVGFAAETQDLQENARAKLLAKNLDLIVANLIGAPDSGFGSEKTQGSLIYGDGRTEAFPRMKKERLADILLDKVLEMKRKSQVSPITDHELLAVVDKKQAL